MNEREFCYWLQGYFEILDASSNRPPEEFTTNQLECIKDHLKLVFAKVTPPVTLPQTTISPAHFQKHIGDLGKLRDPSKLGPMIATC